MLIQRKKLMFKAKLINDEAYYRLRNMQLIFSFASSIAIGLLVNFFDLPLWVALIIGGLLIIGIILSFRNQRTLNSMIGKKRIELDDSEIRIISKKGDQQETIPFGAVDKIILKKEYGLPQESMSEIADELKGQPKRNYLIIQQNDQQRKFDFELDSYYMLNQLNKVIDGWMKKGYTIERG